MGNHSLYLKRLRSNNDEDRQAKTWIGLIGVLIVLIATFHYSTPTRLSHLHELYRAFFYIPIILAAFRFQFKGGISTAAIVIVIYLPHVVFQWGGSFLENFSRFLEMVLYVVVGMVAGYLAEREWLERKKYQRTAQELERSYEKLQHQSEKLAEMEDQLRASEKLSILGELAASLAHEVRNPLGAIWGVVEILKEECQKSGRDAEFTKILIEEVKRLNRVVENYLSLARKQKLPVTICDLGEIVQSVVYLLNYKAKKKGIRLISNSPPKPIFIKANESQLQQVLINILLNSMAAVTDQGTITITAELISDSTEYDPTANGNPTARLIITDTGHGIKPEVMAQLFQPFFTTRQEGTGLGLSIVKRIIDENKWNIEVTSKVGQGTAVTLSFPVEVTDASSI